MNKTQQTFYDVLPAAEAIHNIPHSRIDCVGWPTTTHVVLDNPAAGSNNFTMRFPAKLWSSLAKYVEPNPRRYDTRAYALTRTGRMLLRRHGVGVHE